MARLWALAVWVLVLAVAAAVVAGIARSEAEGGALGDALGDARVGGLSRAALDEIRLSEILAGPARDWTGDGVFDARQDEWLEIANLGSASADLSAYRVSDADSTIRYAFSGSLAPGAFLLVTGIEAEDWQRSAGRSVTGLSLNNAGDTVRLFRIDGADTLEVDVKTYNSIEGASDRSTALVDPSSNTWALFDKLNHYGGSGEPPGTGCAPTPSFANECPTSVQTTTWGRIKRLYR